MIKIGTSGFSFEDWKGTVYPEKIKKEDMLSYYENELGFHVLEVNFTYYTLPSQKAIIGMLRKTSADFEFTVKAFKGLTHEIPKDERELKGVFEKFKYSIAPLIDEGKLSCVLAQFPYSFHCKAESFDYLKRFKEEFGDIPVVVEFRNLYWHKKRVLDFLREHHLGYCIVDEPKLPRLMPFHPATTSEPGYFRFHGRNPNWFGTSAAVRYDYSYSVNELKEFTPHIKKVDKSAKKTLVFFNNCHAGQAAKNAAELARML